MRAFVEHRAGDRCEYCRAPQAVCGYSFHIEHIIPKTLDGSDDRSNRALACASCNLSKADRVSASDPGCCFGKRRAADILGWFRDYRLVAVRLGLRPLV